MRKFEQIDQEYQQNGSRMSVRERINECAKIIYRTHEYLTRYGSRLTAYARSRSRQIIASAESELTRLVTNSNAD
jgi:hypothetical protein